MTQTERQNDLIDLIGEAEQGFDHYRGMLVEMQNLYFSVMDGSLKEYLKKRNKSSLFFNKAQAKMRRVSDSLVKNYFQNDKFVSIEPEREDTDDAKDAKALQSAIKDELEDIKFFDQMSSGLYKLPYIGTLVTRSYWDDGLMVEDVDIDRFFFDPEAKSEQDTGYVVHVVHVTVDDIKRMQRAGVYNREHSIEELVTDTELKGYTRVKLKEIYTKHGDIWKVSTVYDDTYFFRQDVPLKDGLPFNWGGLIRQLRHIDEDTFVGNYFEPFIASIKTLQEEYNVRRNQMIDANKQHLNPKLITGKTSGINPLDLEKPTGHIPAKDPGAIQIQPPPRIDVALQDMQVIDQEMSEISSISPMMNGVAPTSNKTATQTSVEHTEGSLKLEIITRVLNETFFENFMKRIAKLVWKYSDSRHFDGIKRKERDPRVKFVFATGLGVKNDMVKEQQAQVRAQEMQSLIQIAGQLGDQNEIIKLYKGYKKLIRENFAIGGFKNTEEYLGKEEDDDEEMNTPQPQGGQLG